MVSLFPIVIISIESLSVLSVGVEPTRGNLAEIVVPGVVGSSSVSSLSVAGVGGLCVAWVSSLAVAGVSGLSVAGARVGSLTVSGVVAGVVGAVVAVVVAGVSRVVQTIAGVSKSTVVTVSCGGKRRGQDYRKK